MIRSTLALVLALGSASPAFAQSNDEKVWQSITALKEKITAYDGGVGKGLAYWGGKTTKYSLIALGAAYVATAGTEAPKYARFSTRLTRVAPAANYFKNYIGAPALTVGVGLLGASAVVFFAEHLWYGVFGQPTQTAMNQELVRFFNLPAEEQFAAYQADPELGPKLIELNNAVQIAQ